MEIAFYVASAVAIVATLLTIIQTNAVHALLYMIVSLLSAAVVLFTLGAPFIAALEVIIYAGAIMVLFVFVVMMLNLGQQTVEQEREWQTPRTWIGPAVLCLVLAALLAYALLSDGRFPPNSQAPIEPKQVGIALFGPYLLGVELASFVLLAGLVGAFHLGRREPSRRSEQNMTPLLRGLERPQAVSGDGRKATPQRDRVEVP